MGLNPKSLSWWKWKLTKQGEVFGGPEESAETVGLKFVEVTGPEMLIASEPARVEVVWGDTIVRVPDDFESVSMAIRKRRKVTGLRFRDCWRLAA